MSAVDSDAFVKVERGTSDGDESNDSWAEVARPGSQSAPAAAVAVPVKLAGKAAVPPARAAVTADSDEEDMGWGDEDDD